MMKQTNTKYLVEIFVHIIIFTIIFLKQGPGNVWFQRSVDQVQENYTQDIQPSYISEARQYFENVRQNTTTKFEVNS